MNMSHVRALVLAAGLAGGALSAADPAHAVNDSAPATTSTMETALRQDAEHAWKYFERKSSAWPGLASPNIWPVGGGKYDSYDIVTMWDVGSIVMATVSAHSIGLIDQTEFDKRIEGIKSFLERANYVHKTVKLPNFRSRTDNAASIESGYDATDTGRLFVALHVLEKYTHGKHDFASLLRGWTIADTVKDGQISDVKDGQLSPAESYIYRFYVGRGYDLWSVPHGPLYEGQSPDVSPGAREAFLEFIGEIGPIATEPSLVELVELGPTPYALAIAEVLGQRQQQRFDETGQLTSVSETPIDRAPWFTYQGLDITLEGEDAWTVYPYLTDKKWETPKFASDNRVVNSKAAYLWYAVQPNEYTERVLNFVRDHARSSRYGFHPGVYEATKKPATNIDLNTNATILEAIAYILNNRQTLSAK